MSRALPDIYRSLRVNRLAPFFQDFQAELSRLNRQDDSRVCLLTPGPMSETYFEHAYLARYLGFLLVEGEDLTARETGTVSGSLPERLNSPRSRPSERVTAKPATASAPMAARQTADQAVRLCILSAPAAFFVALRP